eukprot:3551455-Pyramimonas_sp.AAC.1
MLDDEQAGLVCQFIELIEQVGHMPSQLRGAISTLMLKVKQQDDIHAQPAFRSIGMLPALYRVWARLRRSAAR